MSAKESVRVKQSSTIKLDPIVDRLFNHFRVAETSVCDVLEGLGLLEERITVSRNRSGTLIEHTVYSSTEKLRRLISEGPIKGIIFVDDKG